MNNRFTNKKIEKFFTGSDEEYENEKNILFYGAQSLALGMCNAVQTLYSDYFIEGFLITSLARNPSVLNGLPVKELAEYAKSLTKEERDLKHILIATPEDLHAEIVAGLEMNGFSYYTCMDSKKEAKLMEQYFASNPQFALLHNQPIDMQSKSIDLQVIQTKFYKDKVLKNKYKIPQWILPLQVGAALTGERVVKYTDDVGENISAKNVNYCELTGLYWLWKNGLVEDGTYYGLFHYRRILDITDEDLLRLKANDVDVILPFPTMHEPNITEHHTRYVKETDWQAMLQALEELAPEYAKALPDIFAQEYMYNYNILVAKREVLADYCAWLFPILERIEELSIPKGSERADRYIGYLGENLLTLYFMYHKDDLKIVHTGRIMLT